MTEYRYLPLDTLSLTADTTHLTMEEFGAYMRLLIGLWIADGEIDVADARRIAGSSRDRWPRLWKRLEQFFDLTTPNRIRQKRLSTTLERVKKTSDANRRRSDKMNAAKALRGAPLSRSAPRQTSVVTKPVTTPAAEPEPVVTEVVTNISDDAVTGLVTSGKPKEEALPINRERASSAKSEPEPPVEKRTDATEPAPDRGGDRDDPFSMPKPRPAVDDLDQPKSLAGRLEAHRRRAREQGEAKVSEP